jgi:DNA-binding GntR family transcriptional regulator
MTLKMVPIDGRLPMAQSRAGAVLSQQIADSVRGSILSGELIPGERIRQEELAAEFGASRFPVREALRILEQRGLVTLAANRGAWVTRLTAAQCAELYQIREQLEPVLLADSIPNLTQPVIAEIAGVLDQLQAVGTLPAARYLDLDTRFHLLTYAGSGMDSVRATVERLLETTLYYRRAYHDLVTAADDRNWILEYDHRLILDAIQRGDAFEGRTMMALHTRRARLALAEHPEIFRAADSAPRGA